MNEYYTKLKKVLPVLTEEQAEHLSMFLLGMIAENKDAGFSDKLDASPVKRAEAHMPNYDEAGNKYRQISMSAI